MAARFPVVLPAIFALALFSACGAPARAPGTVVIASGADLESGNPLVTIHPLSRQLQRHALFVTLFGLDSALEPTAYAARSWQWDSDRRGLNVHVTQKLKWHDGAAFTARDVVFTFQAAADSALASPRRADVAAISRVTATDSFSLRFEFTTPQMRLPWVLAELPIVPEHILDSVPRSRWRQHGFSTRPVGSGPFRFSSRRPGRNWVFERNPDFPTELGGPPRLERLVVAVVDEASTKFAGLVSGELDVAGVSPAMADLVKRDSSLRLLTPPVMFSQVLAFNTTRPPFDDARVRRALSLSIDRDRLVKAAVAGYGIPASGAIPPAVGGRVGDVFPELRVADSLLDASGWLKAESARSPWRTRNGRTLSVNMLSVGGSDMAVEQLIQADLAARGVQVNIRVMELASFLSVLRNPDKTSQSDYDMAVTGIPGDIGLNYLLAMFSSQQSGGALDYTGYHSTQLDAVLAAASNAAPEHSAAAWQRVDDLLKESTPVAWLYHAQGVQGLSRKLEGVIMDLRGELVSVTRWTRE